MKSKKRIIRRIARDSRAPFATAHGQMACAIRAENREMGAAVPRLAAEPRKSDQWLAPALPAYRSRRLTSGTVKPAGVVAKAIKGRLERWKLYDQKGSAVLAVRFEIDQPIGGFTAPRPGFAIRTTVFDGNRLAKRCRLRKHGGGLESTVRGGQLVFGNQLSYLGYRGGGGRPASFLYLFVQSFALCDQFLDARHALLL